MVFLKTIHKKNFAESAEGFLWTKRSAAKLLVDCCSGSGCCAANV
jgi:hypothetical protein